LFSPLYNKAEVRWYPDSSRLYPRSSRISRINFADGSFAGGTMALKVLRSGKRIFPVSTSETGSKRAAGLPWRMIICCLASRTFTLCIVSPSIQMITY
jgi:hypothetical protein